MNPFDYLHEQIKKKFGFKNEYQQNPELDDIKSQLDDGMLRPIEAEKKITAFYKKLLIKTKKYH